MNLASIILRVTTSLGFTTKGSILTWVEEDNNFITLGNAIKALESLNSSNFDAYSSGTAYTITTPATYVSYNSNIWQAVGASTGITPGTDITKWVLVGNGQFSHQKNRDAKLDEGSANEVTSTQLRNVVDNFAKSTANNIAPPDGSVHNLSTGYKFPSEFHTVSNSIFKCTASTISTATWILIFGSGD